MSSCFLLDSQTISSGRFLFFLILALIIQSLFYIPATLSTLLLVYFLFLMCFFLQNYLFSISAINYFRLSDSGFFRDIDRYLSPLHLLVLYNFFLFLFKILHVTGFIVFGYSIYFLCFIFL